MKAKSKKPTTANDRGERYLAGRDRLTSQQVMLPHEHTESIDAILRNRLTDPVAELSPVELTAVISFIESMEDIEDAAFAALHKDDAGVPLDDVLAENGFSRE